MITHLKKVIEAAALLEVPIVGTFVGKDKTKTVPENLDLFSKIWPPIVKFAREHGVQIAIAAWMLAPLACRQLYDAPAPRLSVDALLAL